MSVKTVTADQVRGTKRNRYIVRDSPKNKNQHPRRQAYKCRATQLTPRLDLAGGYSAWDVEGADRANVSYIGSLSGVNEKQECLLDTFTDHGGFRTDNQFIDNLPPKWCGVLWKDLNPRNGAQPIREVIQNFINLTKGRTAIFHSAKGDKARLDVSAAMCGLTIP